MNGNFGKIYIRKRPVLTWLTYFVFLMPFFLQAFLQFFSLPSLLKYLIDVAWIIALFGIIFTKKIKTERRITVFWIFAVFFISYTLIVYLFNFQSVFYYLWGVRNNFRLYAAFILFILFFDKEDIDFCLKFIDVFFWINAAVSFVQFFAFGIKQDYLGGLFGIDLGANASNLILFCIVSAKSILRYMSGEERTWLCIAKCSVSLILAALSELKFFFLIFAFIVVFSLFVTKFSWRKLLILSALAIITVVSGTILTALFDSSVFSVKDIFDLITSENYSSAKDLGRFTAIPKISNTILTEVPQKLFGMGLGNCDTSAFAICNTPFFQSHQYLNYNWFLSAFVFLETGFIGVIMVLSFFVICFVMAFRERRRGGDALLCQMSMIMSIVCVALFFYNSSLRTEAGYFAYFVLALPFISLRDKESSQQISV